MKYTTKQVTVDAVRWEPGPDALKPDTLKELGITVIGESSSPVYRKYGVDGHPITLGDYIVTIPGNHKREVLKPEAFAERYEGVDGFSVKPGESIKPDSSKPLVEPVKPATVATTKVTKP